MMDLLNGFVLENSRWHFILLSSPIACILISSLEGWRHLKLWPVYLEIIEILSANIGVNWLLRDLRVHVIWPTEVYLGCGRDWSCCIGNLDFLSLSLNMNLFIYQIIQWRKIKSVLLLVSESLRCVAPILILSLQILVVDECLVGGQLLITLVGEWLVLLRYLP